MDPKDYFGYDIKFTQKIGQGQFGIVVRCSHPKYPNIELCCKIVDNHMQVDEALVKEITILKKLKHCNNSHIIKIFDIFEKDGKWFIIMELCQGGDMKQQIDNHHKNQTNYAATDILNFVYQFIDGYRLLYENKVMHRDIKPQNIFLGKDGEYKIGDLGAGRIVENMNQRANYTKIGSPIYSSPQVMQAMHFSAKTDIYSLGMVLFQMAFQRFPFVAKFSELEAFQRKLKTTRFQCPFPEVQGTDEQKQEIKSLIEQMLVFDEDQRIGFEAIFERVRDNKVYKQFHKDEEENLTYTQKIRNQKKEKDAETQEKLLTQTKQIAQVNQTPANQTNFGEINIMPLKLSQFEPKKNGLRQYLKVQQGKVTAVEETINKFCLIMGQHLIQPNELEYDLFITSLLGYKSHLLKNIIAIYEGNYNNLCQYLKNDQTQQQEIQKILQEFKKEQDEDDQRLYLLAKTNYNQVYPPLDDLAQQCLLQISKLKIRLQQYIIYRDFLSVMHQLTDYQKFLYFTEVFFELNFKKHLIRQDNQLINNSQELVLFIANVLSLMRLEKDFPQPQLNKESKILLLPPVPSKIDNATQILNKSNFQVGQLK